MASLIWRRGEFYSKTRFFKVGYTCVHLIIRSHNHTHIAQDIAKTYTFSFDQSVTRKQAHYPRVHGLRERYNQPASFSGQVSSTESRSIFMCSVCSLKFIVLFIFLYATYTINTSRRKLTGCQSSLQNRQNNLVHPDHTTNARTLQMSASETVKTGNNESLLPRLFCSFFPVAHYVSPLIHSFIRCHVKPIQLCLLFPL